jgi:hypothetical protein
LLHRDLFQHFQTDFASSDLTQGNDGRLVLGFDLRGVALQQLACAVGRGEGQLEAVRDIFQAIFDGDAGNFISPNYYCQSGSEPENRALTPIQI